MSSTLPSQTQELSLGGSIRGPHRLAGAIGGCPEAFRLHYLERYKPRVEPSFRLLGSLVHDCLAYHFGPLVDDPPSWLSQSLDDRLQQRLLDSDPALIPQAKEVANAYLQTFAADPWKPIFVEREFITTLGAIDPGGPYPELDNELVSCQTDLGVLGNGFAWIVDYKCMGGEWGKDRLPMWSEGAERGYIWQALVNLHIVRQHIPALRGFIIRRVKRRIPYDFDSHQIRPTDRMYADIPRQMRYAVKRDLELQAQAKELGHLPKNLTNCDGKYGPCDYVSVCHAKTDEAASESLAKAFISHSRKPSAS